MSARTPREILADASWYQARSRGAERARVKIRLGEVPRMEGGFLGFRQRPTYPSLTFTPEETSAIYEALAEVRNRNEAEARRLEQTVEVVS